MRTIAPMGRWDPQQTELAYAPKAYPGHGFKGTGTVWAMYLNDVLLGRLSYTGNPATAVIWQPAPDLDDVAWEYANGVTTLLYQGAQADTPLSDVLAQVFALAKVQETQNAELTGLRP